MSPATTVDWAALRAQALLGTDRQPVPPTAPVEEPIEAAVLGAALVESTRRRVGRRPRSLDIDTVPAPDDDRPLAPDRAGQLLDLLLAGQVGGASARPRLVELWLRHCVDAGMVVPHRALPQVLDQAGALDADLVRHGIGARGRWLMARHRSPSGGQDDEADALRPQQGLPENWSSLPARQRADAIAALRARPEDEVDLEAALADKARTVRHAAATQLAALPGSERSRRMGARLGPLIHPPRSLRKLSVELPEPPGTEELADATERAPTQTSVREWWLTQLIGGAPLEVWPAPPAAVVKALAGERGRIQALIRAVVVHRDPEWAEAILDSGVHADDLLALVPQPVAEAVLVRAVRGPQAARAIRAVGGRWTGATSIAVVAALARRKPEELLAFIEGVAVDLGLRLDPGVAPEIERWRSTVGSDHRYVASALGLVLHVLSIRSELHEVFS